MNGRLQSVFDFFEETLPNWYGSREIRNSQVQMAVDIAGSVKKEYCTINWKRKTAEYLYEKGVPVIPVHPKKND